MIWRAFLVVIAFLLLGAHFLRGAHVFVAAACLTAPFLLLIRRRWACLTVQWALYAGTVVWLHTAYFLVQHRLSAQEPWARMLLILVAVAAITFSAGCLLNSATVKKRYS